MRFDEYALRLIPTPAPPCSFSTFKDMTHVKTHIYILAHQFQMTRVDGVHTEVGATLEPDADAMCVVPRPGRSEGGPHRDISDPRDRQEQPAARLAEVGLFLGADSLLQFE